MNDAVNEKTSSEVVIVRRIRRQGKCHRMGYPSLLLSLQPKYLIIDAILQHRL